MFNRFTVWIASLAILGSFLGGASQPKAQSLEAATKRAPFVQMLTEVPVQSAENFLADIEEILFRLTNEERQRAGLPALEHSELMAQYARIKSQDMGDRNYFGHGDPDGRLMQSRLDDDGVDYTVWGENLAMLGGYELSDEELAKMFMTNWMNSESHRANILSPDFAQVGIGVYKSGTRFYATQEFMTP